jgi:hypothetical protein
MVRPQSRQDPVAEIERRLDELRGEHARLQEEIRKARAKQRRLAAEMRTLEAHIALSRDAGRGPVGALQSGTIGDAIEASLRAAGRPQRIIELVHSLQDAGKLLRSEWAYSTVAKALARDRRFRRSLSRRGFWELQDANTR